MYEYHYSAYLLLFWRSYDEKKNIRHMRRHKVQSNPSQIFNMDDSTPNKFSLELFDVFW